MIVLGIHDGHNAGAALVKDGKVLAAISEERLNNIKNYFGSPFLSIKKVFKIAKIPPEEIDLVAIGCLVRVGPPYADINWLGRIQVQMAPYLHSHWFAQTYVKVLHLFRETNYIETYLRSLGIENTPHIFIDHHLSHAACAFYQRPWKNDTVVLTLDGSGDGLSATVSIGADNTIKRIAETTFYDSPSNNLYSEITGYLGMKRWEHEYKVMGLAPYGKDDGLTNEFKKVVRINPQKPLEFQNIFDAYLYEVTKKLYKALVGRRFDNIAWAAQKYFEDLVSQWVKNAIDHTGIHNVVCAGGSFLNVKANKVISELPEIHKAFFYPAADDGGTPVGAALEGYIRLCKEKRVVPKIAQIDDLYYGDEYKNEEIEKIIKKSKWKKKAVRLKNIEKYIAGQLTKGKIVARFAGRCEWGPRALGNRSILADPRDLKVIHKLNFAIKQRDFWMPFAPSILEEDAKSYLTNYHFCPYMIEAFATKKKAQDNIIAGIHPYDRTCRPQSVNLWNLEYKKIIEEFKKITGVPAVLNTSFNLHGYPIVGTPEIALLTFENSGLDILALGNWLIEK